MPFAYPAVPLFKIRPIVVLTGPVLGAVVPDSLSDNGRRVATRQIAEL